MITVLLIILIKIIIYSLDTLKSCSEKCLSACHFNTALCYKNIRYKLKMKTKHIKRYNTLGKPDDCAMRMELPQHLKRHYIQLRSPEAVPHNSYGAPEASVERCCVYIVMEALAVSSMFVCRFLVLYNTILMEIKALLTMSIL